MQAAEEEGDPHTETLKASEEAEITALPDY
jgi:hypothetical protein